jgi:hypothetical protein
MISYTGQSDQFQATIIIFGDGGSKSVTIDLTKAPFAIKPPFAPARAVGFVQGDKVRISTIDIINGKLVIVFENAPEKTNWDYAIDSAGAPRTRIDVYFIYEAPPELRKL